MSKAYNQYLEDHINAVRTAAAWIFKNCDNKKLAEIVPDAIRLREDAGLFPIFTNHDASKYSPEEYDAYDGYFYGPDGIKNNGVATEKVERAFQYAWLHHIHHNPHHWQHWILHNDDKEDGVVILDMPDRYILEMICDWWSFSWRNGNLWSMWNWLADTDGYIQLSEKTTEKVHAILELIRVALLESDLEEFEKEEKEAEGE